MMYILTQEEFDALQEKNKKIAEDAQNIIQELCTRLADSELVKEGWMKGRPWGCYKTKMEEWYCDDCPVQTICPSYKHWSQ